MQIVTKRSSLTPEAILDRVSEYQIYRHYCGKELIIGTAMRSPLRDDRNPSFLISCKGGMYFHMDFAVPEHRGNCFEFVMQKFKVGFHEALQIIDRDFNLGLSSKKTSRQAPKYSEPAKTERAPRLIQVIPKKFTKEELHYWSEYYQGIPELKAENIFSVGKLFIDKQKIILGDPNMCFGYLYEDRYWKIYRPRVKGKGKWISSVPLQTVDGLESIRGSKKAICSKAKKDKMILQYFIPTCSVQNESLAAFSEDTVTYLKGEAESGVFVAFDCDKPGVKSSWEVTQAFGFKHVNVPYEYLQEGIKDFADLARVHGLRTVQQYLKSKEII